MESNSEPQSRAPRAQQTTAEIIAIGDELTSGQRLDTNSQWLATQLSDLGIRTLFHTTVADDREAKLNIMRIAASRVDLVITTGGLGPTADDLTRQVIAELAGQPLELDEESLEKIERMFHVRGREMPENNRIQAHFPKGSQIIPNPHGTAPGIDIRLSIGETGGKTQFYALPGVPAELKQMWQETVRPSIKKMLGSPAVIQHRLVHCFGKGESDIEKLVPELTQRDRQPRIGITASSATITFRIVATENSRSLCLEKLNRDEQFIRDRLGNLVFGSDQDTLPSVVIARLVAADQSLSVEDQGTHGLVSHLLHSANPGQELELNSSVGRATDRPSWSSSIELVPRAGEADGTTFDLASIEAQWRQLSADWGIMILPPDTNQEIAMGQFVIVGPDVCQEFKEPLLGHPSIKEIRFAKYVLNQLRLLLEASEDR